MSDFSEELVSHFSHCKCQTFRLFYCFLALSRIFRTKPLFFAQSSYFSYCKCRVSNRGCMSYFFRPRMANVILFSRLYVLFILRIANAILSVYVLVLSHLVQKRAQIVVDFYVLQTPTHLRMLSGINHWVAPWARCNLSKGYISRSPGTRSVV